MTKAARPLGRPGGSRPVDRLVGERLRLRLQLRGISARELSERLGISLQQINRYETGAAGIAAGRLLEIAQVLGVTVQYFFQDAPIRRNDHGLVRGPGEEEYARGIVAFARSSDGVELNRAFATI